MVRALPYIILGLIVYMALFYMENYRPQLLTELLIQVDVFGVTKVAENEQERLEKIKYLRDPDDPSLYLSDDKKQVLINHTVFMGATQEMVILALGSPQYKTNNVINGAIVNGIKVSGTVTSTDYKYFLGNDKRPTVLVFQDDRLVNAYKGSANLDLK